MCLKKCKQRQLKDLLSEKRPPTLKIIRKWQTACFHALKTPNNSARSLRCYRLSLYSFQEPEYSIIIVLRERLLYLTIRQKIRQIMCLRNMNSSDGISNMRLKLTSGPAASVGLSDGHTRLLYPGIPIQPCQVSVSYRVGLITLCTVPHGGEASSQKRPLCLQ